jgi:site-specific DNA recombinase
VLTVAYCRVSTDEQAAEGFSIDGQAEKLRAYAALRELGPVTVIEDPGRSGKDLNRPGLRQVLDAVERGHVSNILIWRLDRLSRNLGDLIELADQFGKAGVGLYSFTEQLDLSSATGRMQFNILGTFAQFYREQLAENVKMGTAQGARQGKWMNRAKTGYSMVDGDLMPNDDAPIVRRIFRLRAAGLSYRDIESDVGVKYSTVRAILLSRIYLGEVLHGGQWYPGNHEALITEEEFRAATRGHIAGSRRSKNILSGRVACGLCGRREVIQYAPDGRALYRCHHRGRGCKQPARTAQGLLKAALLGLRLISSDHELREAIREELRRSGRQQAKRSRPDAVSDSLPQLSRKRQKLLDLYYSERSHPSSSSSRSNALPLRSLRPPRSRLSLNTWRRLAASSRNGSRRWPPSSQSSTSIGSGPQRPRPSDGRSSRSCSNPWRSFLTTSR